MSWRSSNNFRARSTSGYTSRATTPTATLDPTVRGIIIAVTALGLILLVLLVVFNPSSSGQRGSAAAARPAALAVSTATALPAATATPAVTATAAAASAPATPAAILSTAEIGPESTTGDAAAGQVLFNGMPTEAVMNGAVNCVVCHNIAPGSATLVGPSLSSVGQRAATRMAGLTAAQYLRVSIINPNAYVVDTFPAGIMTPTFAQALTPDQIEDLVAYLLTLP